MWKAFKTRAQSWSLVISNPTAVSTSEATKQAHELRVLNLLLPTILDVTPERVWKRESPDFEVMTTDNNLYVELVDAVPDAVSASSTMNLAQRRSRENRVPYHVKNEQFGETIAREIAAKRNKANQWVSREPALQGKLVLFVNGGHGSLWLRHYFCDARALDAHVPLTVIDPFAAIVLGDETGAFVWGGTR